MRRTRLYSNRRAINAEYGKISEAPSDDCTSGADVPCLSASAVAEVARVAERPDAAPGRANSAFRAAAHAAVLAGVLAFILYYCVWLPIRGAFAAAFDSARVLSVANPLTQIHAPEVTGVFHAAGAFANGSWVSGGQILGRIESA